MRTLNPRKLLLSKWTATTPVNKEKHFLVTRVLLDEAGRVVEECIIEAVYTRRPQAIDWQSLKDETRWKSGWQ